MSFEIAVKKAEGVERLLGVTVSLETVKAAEDKALKRYASAARMPGFRPGKAPTHLIRKAYAEQIKSEALETLVQDAWKQALDQEKLEPIAAAARPRPEVRGWRAGHLRHPPGGPAEHRDRRTPRASR